MGIYICLGYHYQSYHYHVSPTDSIATFPHMASKMGSKISKNNEGAMATSPGEQVTSFLKENSTTASKRNAPSVLHEENAKDRTR